MMKEFHPETRGPLQILIDAGRTMRQQSYLATKLDEAVAVAQLLTESVVGSGNRVGIWVFNETEIVKAMKPAMAEEQLIRLRELTLTLRAPALNEETATGVPFPRAPWLGMYDLPLGERMAMFVRLLKLKLTQGYRRTGMYKALTEATSTGLHGFLIILTDLQASNDALLRVAPTLRQRGDRVIVGQIGASWRLSFSLENAYPEYQNNSRTLRRLQHLGLTVFDLRTERFTETIAQHIRYGRVSRIQTL